MTAQSPTDLFKNKYRIKSTRFPENDYTQPGYYFVTFCTRDREHFFGEIISGEMQLSPIGEIVTQEWVNTGIVRPNVRLDEWIIMPNHIHMIVVITDEIDSGEGPENRKETPHQAETPHRGVSTRAASRKWKANSLGSIIGQFKGMCTRRIRARGHTDFGWQSRFYDRIIRTEDELDNMRFYIRHNPANWETDRNNLVGIDM